MFDPERDHDPGVRTFYVRLLAIAVVSAGACVALWPSVSGFSAGPDHDKGCVAIRDGWHSEVPPPSAAEVAAANAAMPPTPTAEQVQDPEFMNTWRAKLRDGQASPAVAVANSRIDWLDGPGACVSESKHRLVLSGVGLGALLLLTVGLSMYLRRTKPPGHFRSPSPRREASPI
jgi:hypothetical protein